ncbi:flagellar assembly peptidoglycan hydrolase FlgJ [Parachitinimonas caeni]|uniref:Peptidoglycan hydrolase FlgJ n=1 Tax=Parachitinimonas caeni TaxID=3031301 RepID=A0ABT7DYJ0_9NEIS|nr:flagellar assembly peptidoglycan hydrolase FlgJ [Parachitinimonas caeni]MDK2123732.1 flagellar assembly peptidoglycan hydrolase FlgJ [Parachitinimonas caeni]
MACNLLYADTDSSEQVTGMNTLTRSDVLTTQRLAIDSQSIGELKALTKGDAKAAASTVAKQFEALFMNMLMKSMRDATPHYDELESNGSQMFRGMLDQQMAQSFTTGHGHGLGLADMIERQIELITNPALRNQAIKRPQSYDFAQATAAAKTAVTPAKTAGAATAAASAAAAEPTDFVETIGRHALPAAQALNLSPHLMIAHAALESGWGRKPIVDAQGNNTHNLFGIKASRDWTGRTADITTTEYIDGVAQKRVERFRAYDSYEDAFADYAKLLTNRYSEATRSGADAKAFGDALKANGYATDPAYAQKVAKVASHRALQAYRVA